MSGALTISFKIGGLVKFATNLSSVPVGVSSGIEDGAVCLEGSFREVVDMVVVRVEGEESVRIIFRGEGLASDPAAPDSCTERGRSNGFGGGFNGDCICPETGR